MAVSTVLCSLGSGCSAHPATTRTGTDIRSASNLMPDGHRWTTENLTVRTEGSYCYDDAEPNCGRYGRLYTWAAADEGCRALGSGWRLPTDDEWRRLASRFGGVSENAADSGKAAYAALVSGGSSGMNTLLGGRRDAADGQYSRLEAHGFYWTASEADRPSASYYNFGRGGLAFHRQTDGPKPMALSVRCVGSAP